MITFCTIVWGEMADMYLKGTLPSLLQPNNLPVARGLVSGYDFYASGEALGVIQSHPLYRRLEALVFVRWHPLQRGPWHVNSNILHHLERAAEEACHAALLPPDVVFGDGSIFNLAALTQQGFDLILWGYPKVDGEGFAAITEALAKGVVSNRDLVSLSLPHVVNGAYTLTPVGGERWYVSHRVPAPCLKPDSAVLYFWRQNPMPNGGHDHVLPHFMIQAGYSWHLIDQSDDYFQAELSTGWAGFGPDSGPRGWNPEMAEAYERWASQWTQVWQGVGKGA